MTRILRLRHDTVKTIRDYMDEHGFVEIETPLLTRSTPEGARDFLVPSRLWPGTFYALPQSPQQLKQLLMVAGQDRYYQIVRCLRDEAPRADRSFEFTQLDVEMSFVDEADIQSLIEPLYAEIVRRVAGVEVAQPFPRMTYAEMLSRYGSDKPDLRYGMELADLSAAFEGTSFGVFASALSSGGAIKGLAAPGAGSFSRSELDQLVQDAKGRGAAGLVWLVVGDGGTVRSPVEKHLSAEEIASVLGATGANPGDLVCIVADRLDRVNVALDGLRRLADRLGLIGEGTWAYCWMTEPPLFEWSDEEGKWVSVHHPFTAPASDDIDPATATARAYDLVLNGYELGGGSIRIHDPAVQARVFGVLGLGPDETEAQFGHLLQAFRFGAPPHGGIALGIDRLVMLLAGKDAIREVTAFPKAQSGADPLTGAPAPVDPSSCARSGSAWRSRRRRRSRRRAEPMEELGEGDRELLRGKNFAHIATIDPDGAPQVTVTWIDVDAPGHVLVNSAVGRRKDRNIRRDPRVTVSIHEQADPYRWLWVGHRRVDRDRSGGRGAHRRPQPALPRRRALDLDTRTAARDLPHPAGPRAPLGLMGELPLAARMRPRTFEEFVGQQHLLGQGRALSEMIGAGHLPSLILWGPSGSGKTTLAHLLAAEVGAHLAQLSAVSSGVADARKIVEGARDGLFQTVLFVDEVHRWSKSQQDVLLPAVEDGTVTLIGATTENPFFSLNTPLLSRCLLLRLEPLGDDDLRGAWPGRSPTANEGWVPMG